MKRSGRWHRTDLAADAETFLECGSLLPLSAGELAPRRAGPRSGAKSGTKVPHSKARAGLAHQSNNFSCTGTGGHRGPGGFTLIELLIVIAMLSILSTGFFTVVAFTITAEAEDGLRATLRQEGLQIVRAILRDAHLAGGEIRSVGDLRADDKTLLLLMAGSANPAQRRIGYRLNGERLERLVWDGADSTPTVQLLGGHVRSFKVERTGGLARIELGLGINRYTKDFVERYTFATRVGGVFGQLARSSPR